MDGNRFDSLSKALASGRNRRTVLKGLLGLGGATLAGSLALESDTDAARRPTPTPKPPKCPGRQTPCQTGCCCPSGLQTCGPDCCNPAGQVGTPAHSECCDNACCQGSCYGEELCCPFDRVLCTGAGGADPICCGAGELCCGSGAAAHHCYPAGQSGGCCTADADCPGCAHCQQGACVEGCPAGGICCLDGAQSVCKSAGNVILCGTTCCDDQNSKCCGNSCVPNSTLCCQADTDCGPCGVCTHGICGPGNDCGECSTCTYDPDGYFCQANEGATCTPARACSTGTCNAQGGCVADDPDCCVTDMDCGPCHDCINGECVTGSGGCGTCKTCMCDGELCGCMADPPLEPCLLENGQPGFCNGLGQCAA